MISNEAKNDYSNVEPIFVNPLGSMDTLGSKTINMALSPCWNVVVGSAYDYHSPKDKLNYLELPIPAAPVPAVAGQQVPPETLAAHAIWVKGQEEIAVLMLMTMKPDL
ncbi:hypothetical protein Tco_0720383 [Tanacetum coccineum]